MIETRTRACFRNSFVAVVLAATAWTALPAEEIPVASPEEVGMSSERLLEIDAVMKRHIDAGGIQGAVTVVARRGKVVHFEAYGLMDVDRGSADGEGLDLPHGLLVQTRSRGGGDDDDRGGASSIRRTRSRSNLPEFAGMQVAVLKEPADEDVSPGVRGHRGQGAGTPPRAGETADHQSNTC